jgi:DNA polymerase
MIYLDYETYSECDIKIAGAYQYSVHPSTEILCMAFAFDDEPVQLWTPDNCCNLDKLFLLVKNGSLIEAHNAFFERCIWQNVAIKKYGFLEVQASQWRCSAAQVAALALPRSLSGAALALECEQQKDESGKKIMLQLSQPKLATKKDSAIRYSKDLYADKYEELYKYCIQDVETERNITKITRPLIESEQEIWLLDQEINWRGILIDRRAVLKAIHLSTLATGTALKKIKELTDNKINSFTQTIACTKWATGQGYEMEKFNKAYLEEKVKDKTMPQKVREVIELRQKFGKTSVAKYQRMFGSMGLDDRIRDNYMYHGASTGRWAGMKVQFQNLPRGKIKDVNKKTGKSTDIDMDTAVSILNLSNNDSLFNLCYEGNFMDFLSTTLRGMVIAPEGKNLYVADYSAIEARGVAWLSDQMDLVEDFRNGGKIYEKQAAAAYGKELEDILALGKESIERFVGKTLVLACGYGMGAKKFQATCAASGVELDLEFCEKAIKAYRKKNSMIIAQWYDQESAALKAIRSGKLIVEGKIKWQVVGKFLYCRLPSGRCLAYYKPSIKEAPTSWGEPRDQLHIWGEKQVEGRKIWCEQTLYGGLIVENIVQALCRDLMAGGMLALKTAGYEIVMHSHDEIISEASEDFGNVKEYENLMCTLPAWATGFPIKAEGWVGKRYKK